MCGICGLIGTQLPVEETTRRVLAMNERIAHRGPDGEGIVAHVDATIAMKRLAIVDVVHGAQPMLNEDESVALVYNGEVYNALKLRRDLEQRGVQFRTRSDTEVILRLYEQNPDDVERHLAGMWAFAIHDRRRKRFVLSRDRFGIKPLFVADGGAGRPLAFASELRCFDRSFAPLSHLFEVDHDAAHAMVSWSYVPEDATIYKGVRRLAPASRMTIDLTTGARSTHRYWSLAPSADAARVRSLDEACEGVETLLRRSVKEHLESDVPVATFLSGGIDSSLITAYANDAAPKTVEAYSIGFDEPRFDESPFASATAQKIGVPLRVKRFDEATARSRLGDALLAYDEPFGDSSSLATYLLSSHVAQDYKVALGGDGGDEVFAGYKKYLVVKMRGPFRRVPRFRDAFGAMLSKLPTFHDRTRGWTELLRTSRRLSRGLTGTDAYVYAQLTQVSPLARTAPLMRAPADPARFLREAEARFAQAEGNELQRSLAGDLANVLPNDMLVKVDRASMACHLEARVPFLDHRVVEYGVGLPSAYTVGDSPLHWSGKRVLRTLHERRFGPELARRKKMGFGVPVEKWLRGPFDQACTQLFDRARLDRFGILASEELGDGGFRRWVKTDPILVWHAFALAAWCEANLGDGPDALRAMLQD